MQAKIVPRDTVLKLASLEGDIRLEPNASLEAEDASINISGQVVCEGDALIKGSLTAARLYFEHANVAVQGDLKITEQIQVNEGGLEVSGNLTARSVSVDQALQVGRDFEADTVEVGGRFAVGGRIRSRTVNVGGTFECQSSVDVGLVVVGRSVMIGGESKIQEMDVGGSVKLAGGDVTGKIAVTGTFQSGKSLSFGEIDVGGSIALTGISRGGYIDVGGRVKVEGDLEFRTLTVGGRVEITRSCRGESARVGGRLEVAKDLEVADKLEVGTRIKVGEALLAKSLELAGSLEAKEAIVEDTARIGGMIDTRHGLRARRIQTASNWEIKGPLMGKEVDLGRNAEAEDVYAQDLRMSDGAKAGSIHAARISIGDNCRVSGMVEYTESIVQGKGFIIGSGTPRKVKQLPDFPPLKHSLRP